MQPFDLIETYAYEMSKNTLSDKEEIECNNIIKRYKKMINFDDVTKENIKEHDQNWPHISDHPHIFLIIHNWRL